MNQYTLGKKVTLTITFTANSISTDPGTVTFKMREPDGVVTTYEYGTDAGLIQDATGVYHVDWVTAKSGLHAYRFEGTDPCQTAEEEHFYVNQSVFAQEQENEPEN